MSNQRKVGKPLQTELQARFEVDHEEGVISDSSLGEGDSESNFASGQLFSQRTSKVRPLHTPRQTLARQLTQSDLATMRKHEAPRSALNIASTQSFHNAMQHNTSSFQSGRSSQLRSNLVKRAYFVPNTKRKEKRPVIKTMFPGEGDDQVESQGEEGGEDQSAFSQYNSKPTPMTEMYPPASVHYSPDPRDEMRPLSSVDFPDHQQMGTQAHTPLGDPSVFSSYIGGAHLHCDRKSENCTTISNVQISAQLQLRQQEVTGELIFDRPLDPYLQEASSSNLPTNAKMSLVTTDSNKIRSELPEWLSDNRGSLVMTRFAWLGAMRALFDSLESFKTDKLVRHVEKSNFLQALNKIKPSLSLLDPADPNFAAKSNAETYLSLQEVTHQFTEHLPDYFSWDNLFDVLLFSTVASQFVCELHQTLARQSFSRHDNDEANVEEHHDGCPQTVTPLTQTVTVLSDPVARKQSDEDLQLREHFSDSDEEDCDAEIVDTHGDENPLGGMKGQFKFSFAAAGSGTQHPQMFSQGAASLRNKSSDGVSPTQNAHSDNSKTELGQIDFSEAPLENAREELRQAVATTDETPTQFDQSTLQNESLSRPPLEEHFQRLTKISTKGDDSLSDIELGRIKPGLITERLRRAIEQVSPPTNQQIFNDQSPQKLRQTAAFNSIAMKERVSHGLSIGDQENGSCDILRMSEKEELICEPYSRPNETVTQSKANTCRNHDYQTSPKVQSALGFQQPVNYMTPNAISEVSTPRTNRQNTSERKDFLSVEKGAAAVAPTTVHNRKKSMQSYFSSEFSLQRDLNLEAILKDNYTSLSSQMTQVLGDQAPSSLNSVRSINLARNQIFKVPDSLPRQLLILNISNNKLKSLAGVEACSRLTFLNASFNQLQSATALAQLIKMKELHLSHNWLPSAALKDLADLKALTMLDLAYNKFGSDLDKWNVFRSNRLSRLEALNLVGNLQLTGKSAANLESFMKQLFPALTALSPKDFSTKSFFLDKYPDVAFTKPLQTQVHKKTGQITITELLPQMKQQKKPHQPTLVSTRSHQASNHAMATKSPQISTLMSNAKVMLSQQSQKKLRKQKIAKGSMPLSPTSQKDRSFISSGKPRANAVSFQHLNFRSNQEATPQQPAARNESFYLNQTQAVSFDTKSALRLRSTTAVANLDDSQAKMQAKSNSATRLGLKEATLQSVLSRTLASSASRKSLLMRQKQNTTVEEKQRADSLKQLIKAHDVPSLNMNLATLELARLSEKLAMPAPNTDRKRRQNLDLSAPLEPTTTSALAGAESQPAEARRGQKTQRAAQKQQSRSIVKTGSHAKKRIASLSNSQSQSSKLALLLNPRRKQHEKTLRSASSSQTTEQMVRAVHIVLTESATGQQASTLAQLPLALPSEKKAATTHNQQWDESDALLSNVMDLEHEEESALTFAREQATAKFL